MELVELTKALRRGAVDNHRCLGCGYEHDCSIHGCRIMKDAADKLEQLQNELVEQKTAASAEKQACFRLGQKDMQENLISVIQRASASFSNPIILGWFKKAADLVRGMEVP